MNAVNRYNPEEILAIFQANYLQQQQFDPEVELEEELTFDTTIDEWRNICDLLSPHELAGYFNYFFELDIPVEKWISILQPQNIKTLKEVCEFIAENTVKALIRPIRLFGVDCQSAATFRHLMNRFKTKGIEVKEIKPSSLLEPFAKDNLVILIEEVNKINPSALSQVVYKRNFISGFGIIFFLLGFIGMIVSIWLSNLFWLIVSLFAVGIFVIWIGSKYKPSEVLFSEINTFRDLIGKIERK